MPENYELKLRSLLRTLFQFDSADLDFGIYRIMNKKRDEIEKFINEDLIDAVGSEFAKYEESDIEYLNEQLGEIESEIMKNFGSMIVDTNGKLLPIYSQIPLAKDFASKYTEIKSSTKKAGISDQHKAEVYSHIYHFFSRYYDNGDFLSLRRYSQNEKYAIPYNGEEVLLHWANKDQYYIKTGEYFKNYTFKEGDYTVNFQLVDAKNTTNNNKSDQRYFVFSKVPERNPDYNSENKSLTIFFEFRGLNKDEIKEYGTKNIQESILENINISILSNITDSGLITLLKKIKNEKTILMKHLSGYTKRNTTDYFIHKNLKVFLTNQLDFYIKNEVLQLDNLGLENDFSSENYITQIKVIKVVCVKIIDFLAQIEDFQKRIFEKKKFVLTCEYCMTLDKVPESLYPDIIKNKNQLEEWKRLYSIGLNKQKNIADFESDSIDLKSNPYLVIDTKFFDDSFKDRLLANFDNIDEATDGLMIKSENWQALNLLLNKYVEQIECIYIDPPYNTGNDDFIYKDNFQHSTWATMMYDRLDIAKNLMSEDSSLFVSIDDEEQAVIRMLQDNIFGSVNFVANIIWQKKFSPQNDARWFSDNHDFITCYAKNKNLWQPNLLPRTSEQDNRYKNIDDDERGPWTSGDLSVKTYSAEYDYPIMTPSGRVVNPPSGYCWRVSKEKFQELVDDNRIWFGNEGNNVPRLKRFLCDVKNGITPLTVWTHKEVGHNQEGKQELKSLLSDGDEVFGTPKVVRLLDRIITIGSNSNSFVLDFFAGSGTTAHAVLEHNKHNKDADSNRKYILIEMGEYFDTIVKPRIQKIMYSSDWKNGKAQSKDGQSHIFKYQTLEQYEDSLNNIEFTQSGSVQRTLMDMDGYFLRYMLDFETEDSPCRLNVENITKPFSYTLKITENQEIKEKNVDLVETFNYLLGIHVLKIRTFTNNEVYYKVIVGTKNNEQLVIVWRDTEDIDLKADKEFIEETILKEFKPAKTYINSDFHVKDAYSIEPEFKQLMGA